MAELSNENKNLLTGSEVFVPMNDKAGFVVSIPQGAKVTMSKDQGALSMYTEDPNGPQATMKAINIADIEANPERAMHMQTVKGLEEPGSEITIHRHKEGGTDGVLMSATASGDVRLNQGVTSITQEQMMQAIPNYSPSNPAQKSEFKPG